MPASQLTPAQNTFIKAITDKVDSLVGSQLPGKFQMVSYPPGFHPAIQYGQPPYYNSATLDAFNSSLSIGSNGMLTLGESAFSTTYFKILTAASYQYSDADNKVVQDPNIQSQQIAVTNTASSSGFASAYSIAAPVTYFAVIKAVLDNFGADGAKTFTTGNISAAAKNLGNAGFSGLQAAIASAVQQLAPLNAILNKQSESSNELAAAQANTQNPSAANGGLQTGASSFYVGWAPTPTNNQIQGGLEGGGKVTINVQASNFSSTESHLSINGSAGFTVPVGGLFDISIGGSSSYNVSKYATSSSSLDMTLEYPGVSLVQMDPMALSADYAKGWYDETMLQSIIKGSGDSSISGFKIPPSSQFNIPDTFGDGKTFSRLKTLVISMAPTITMVFKAAEASKITSDFKEQATASVKLFGLFSVGSASESYTVSKVDSTSVAGQVSVTLAPPAIKGTVPLEKQVCYILGGVAFYPPA